MSLLAARVGYKVVMGLTLHLLADVAVLFHLLEFTHEGPLGLGNRQHLRLRVLCEHHRIVLMDGLDRRMQVGVTDDGAWCLDEYQLGSKKR